MTAKFKFGQNLPRRKRAAIAARLEARGQGCDLETAAAIDATTPFR